MNNEYEVRGKDTAIFIERKNGERYEAIISTDDLEKVKDFIGSWYVSRKGKRIYVLGYGGLLHEEKKHWSLHRWITDAPEHLVVDHINHDTLDNRRINLRVISQAANMLNRKNKAGVTRYKDRWKGQIQYKGERILVGYFDNREEAEKKVEELRGQLLARDEELSAWEQDLIFFREQVQGLRPDA